MDNQNNQSKKKSTNFLPGMIAGAIIFSAIFLVYIFAYLTPQWKKNTENQVVTAKIEAFTAGKTEGLTAVSAKDSTIIAGLNVKVDSLVKLAKKPARVVYTFDQNFDRSGNRTNKP